MSLVIPSPTPAPFEAVTADTDPLIVAIVSVALTLVVSLVVGAFTSYRSRRTEHEKWLRERLYETSREIVAGADFYHSGIGLPKAKPSPDAQRRAAESIAALALVSSTTLYRLAGQFQDAAWDLYKAESQADPLRALTRYEDARRAFLMKAREEIGV